MALYPVTEDTLFVLYKAPWITDLFCCAPDPLCVNNKITVKTAAEWDAMVQSAGGDAALLASLNISVDYRDGI